MPRATIASRSSSSTSSVSCSSAISAARSARNVGVATFAGRFCRSRAALAASAATPGALDLVASTAVARHLERLDAAVAVLVASTT